MSTFKDMVAADRDNVFLNTDEFAESRLVEGNTINVSWQDDEAMEDSDLSLFGCYAARMYAKVEDLPDRKAPGDILWVDHVAYTIEQWSEAAGMAVLLLSRPHAG